MNRNNQTKEKPTETNHNAYNAGFQTGYDEGYQTAVKDVIQQLRDHKNPALSRTRRTKDL